MCSTKRFQDSHETLRLKTDEMRSKMTALQEVVDGVREAQEVVRNLQHNAATFARNGKLRVKSVGKMSVRVAETQGKL